MTKTTRRTPLRFTQSDYGNFSLFFCYSTGSVVIPMILISMSNALGFSLEDGGMGSAGLLTLVRMIANTFCLICSGFFSVHFGNRKSLRGATVIILIALTISSLVTSYLLLLLILLIVGLGEGIVEGLTTPYIQELHKEESGRYLNFTHGFWSVGIFVSTITMGFILNMQISWRIILFSVGLLYIAPLIILSRAPKNFNPVDTNNQDTEHIEKPKTFLGSMKENIQHSHRIFRNLNFWKYFSAMFFAGGAEFVLTFWVASYIQLYYAVSVWVAGVGVTVFSLGMLMSRTLIGHYVKQEHLLRTLLLSALIGTLCTIFLPFSPTPLIFMLILFFSGACIAPFWPSIQSHCVNDLSDLDPTTLFILLSCAGVPGAGFFAWITGLLADQFGGNLTYAFFLVPLCTILVFLLLSIPHRTKSKSSISV